MKANRSKTYLFPLLSREIRFNLKFFNKIINVYIKDTKKVHENAIFIEFKKETSDSFSNFEQALMRNSLFIGRYDKNNKLIYVFNFPKRFITEYELFLESKYSKFGEDSKVYILNFWRPLSKTKEMLLFYRKVKGILYKEETLKVQIEEELRVVLSEDAELGELIIDTDESVKIE